MKGFSTKSTSDVYHLSDIMSKFDKIFSRLNITMRLYKFIFFTIKNNPVKYPHVDNLSLALIRSDKKLSNWIKNSRND